MSVNSVDRFVQNDSHCCDFVWNFGYRCQPEFSKIKKKELKIASCKVNWKLQFEFTNDYRVNRYKIGFQGENLGSHSGILTLNSQGSPICVKLSRFEVGMRWNECSHVMGQDYVSGTIAILYCDCIQNPNKGRLEEENVIELKNDIHILLKNKQFTDIDIKVDGTCFPVHKLILRARSPVFARMLEHDMKECQENCITVSDTNGKIMESFVSFLYSGSLEHNNCDTLIGLYSLADKYQVTSLLKTCRTSLISSISESTVLEILKVSDLHTDEELKEKATQFISGQFSKIEPSPEWSSFIDSNTRLASYVLRFVSAKCAISSK